MITIDITMPIHIINILILIVIMNAVLYRPIRSILVERQKKIAGLEEEIQTFEKNSKQRLEEFDNKLSAARSKAKAQFEAAKGEAMAASSEELAGVRKEADGVKVAELGKIEEQFTSAQSQLKSQLDSFAGDMASKILGRAVA